MRRLVAVAITLALSITLALAIAAQARDRKISSDRTATNLSAFGQGLLWSRTAADGRSRLVLRGFGPPADVPLTPASGLFDADIGQNSAGSTVAVYARCAGISGRNCDVYEYDFARARERKLPGASTSRCSEFAPSVWQGAVAFARSGSRRCNGLYVKGTRGAALLLDRRVAADTDFREGRVAYLYAPNSRTTSIRIFSIKEGSSRVVIASLRSEGERTRVTDPSFAGNYLYWLFEDVRRKNFRIGRSRAHARSRLQFSERRLKGRPDSIAVDGRTVYYTNGRGVFQANDPAPRFVTGH
jgi:hypothetical protein